MIILLINIIIFGYKIVFSIIILFFILIITTIEFPIVQIIYNFDMVYVSVMLSLVLTFMFALVFIFYIRKMIFFNKIRRFKNTIAFIISSFILTFGFFSCDYEATKYIENIAKEKYNQKVNVHINYSEPWNYHSGISLGRPIYGNSHAEIMIKDKFYHWSFKQRDFVLDK